MILVRFRFLTAAFFSLALMPLAVPALAEEEGSARRITVQQAPMAELAPARPSSLEVGIWADRADSLYVPGDDVTVFVRVTEPAYVTVYNVDANGDVTVLFPNAFARDNFIRQAGVITLPARGTSDYALRVGPPYGTNLLKVVATDSPVPIVELSRGESFVTGRAESMSRQISVVQTNAPAAAKFAMADHLLSVVGSRPVASTSAQSPASQSPAPSPQPGSGTTTVIVPPGQQVTISGGTPVSESGSAQSSPDVSLEDLTSAFFVELSLDRQAYAPDDPMRVSVTAERACSLSLMSVDPNGRVSVIYPNERTSRVRLRAGRATYLPPANSGEIIRASSQAGEHHLLAVCARNRSTIDAIVAGDSRATLTTGAVGAPTLESVLETSGDRSGVGRRGIAYQIEPR